MADDDWCDYSRCAECSALINECECPCGVCNAEPSDCACSDGVQPRSLLSCGADCPVHAPATDQEPGRE